MSNKIDGRFAKSVGNFKNRIINGDMRVNQRGFDGSTFVDGDYCWDRWKATASAMTQIIEEGEFKPSTVYTLSGTGVTTQQITSPASGHWTLPDIPRTATNVQLEEGSVATKFEQRPLSIEQMLCYRYYYTFNPIGWTYSALITTAYHTQNSFPCGKIFMLPTEMRVNPTTSSYESATGFTGPHTVSSTKSTVGVYTTYITADANPYVYFSNLVLDAEL